MSANLHGSSTLVNQAIKNKNKKRKKKMYKYKIEIQLFSKMDAHELQPFMSMFETCYLSYG